MPIVSATSVGLAGHASLFLVRLVIVALCWLAGLGSLEAAWVEVGAGSQRATVADFVNSTTQAYPAAVAAGNLLMVAGRCFNGTAATTSVTVTDTLSSSYTIVLGAVHATNYRTWIAYGLAPSAGANTVTINPDSIDPPNDHCGAAIDEFSGAANPVADVNGGDSTATSTTASDSMTTGVVNALVLGVMGHTGIANPTLTVGAGYTQIGENENNTTQIAFNLEFQIVTTVQAYTVDWTIGTSQNWQAQTHSFTPALGAVTGTLGLLGVGR